MGSFYCTPGWRYADLESCSVSSGLTSAPRSDEEFRRRPRSRSSRIICSELWAGRRNRTLEVFGALRDIGYRGPLVFETTRGTDPVETARFHMATCNFFSYDASLA